MHVGKYLSPNCPLEVNYKVNGLYMGSISYLSEWRNILPAEAFFFFFQVEDI